MMQKTRFSHLLSHSRRRGSTRSSFGWRDLPYLAALAAFVWFWGGLGWLVMDAWYH